MKFRFFLCMLLVILAFTSCTTTYHTSYIQVELLKPALITLPNQIDTIAVFKRDLYQSDTTTFKYLNVNNNVKVTDKSVHYKDLSNICVDELAVNLEKNERFLKVVNYKDSMNLLFSNTDSSFNYKKLHETIGSNVCIFLDFFNLNDHIIYKNQNYLESEIKEKFPEFRNSSDFESIDAMLLWTVTIKGDSGIYVFKQPDKLYYGNSVYPDFFGNNIKHRLLLENAAAYLGKTFAAKIVPSWQKTDRTYYRSNNNNMKQAEKCCLEGNWLKAAEIYKLETKNKNRNISAKAKYNMAVVCEMEGKLDAATDWLIQSYSTFKFININEEHQFNCQHYINELSIRIKELDKLDKQLTQSENNESN